MDGPHYYRDTLAEISIPMKDLGESYASAYTTLLDLLEEVDRYRVANTGGVMVCGTDRYYTVEKGEYTDVIREAIEEIGDVNKIYGQELFLGYIPSEVTLESEDSTYCVEIRERKKYVFFGEKMFKLVVFGELSPENKEKASELDDLLNKLS